MPHSPSRLNQLRPSSASGHAGRHPGQPPIRAPASAQACPSHTQAPPCPPARAKGLARWGMCPSWIWLNLRPKVDASVSMPESKGAPAPPGAHRVSTPTPAGGQNHPESPRGCLGHGGGAHLPPVSRMRPHSSPHTRGHQSCPVRQPDRVLGVSAGRHGAGFSQACPSHGHSCVQWRSPPTCS